MNNAPVAPVAQKADDPAAIQAQIADLEHRLVTLRTPKKVEFPKTIYKQAAATKEQPAAPHSHESCVVNSQAELDKLEGSWSESPDPKAPTVKKAATPAPPNPADPPKPVHPVSPSIGGTV